MKRRRQKHLVPAEFAEDVRRAALAHPRRQPKRRGHTFVPSESPLFLSDIPLSKMLMEQNHALKKAMDSLARYKFQMFGYWAANWVYLNRLSGFNDPNPFADLVKAARKRGYGPRPTGSKQ